MPDKIAKVTPLSHSEAERLLKLATRASVITAATLIITKLAAYVYTDSVSVLASLIDSFMDIGASMLNLAAVNYSLQPPDEEHRFGHGKAESLAGLAQGTFIAGSGVFLIVHAIERLYRPTPVQGLEVGVGVMVFAILATLLLIAIQQHVVKKTGSTAIKADSIHYRADVLTNGAIIAALLLSKFGWSGVDPLFAMVIAVYILYSAWGVGSEAFHDLLDRELSDEFRERIVAIATSHEDVYGVHELRTRLSGRTEFIQMHLELNDLLPLIEAHRIADEVEQMIITAIPTSDVVIHQDPVGLVGREGHETPGE